MPDTGKVNEGTTVELGTTDRNEALAKAATRRPQLGVARYDLKALIGKGGMGEVYGATDQQIGREVAVKRMKSAAPTTR